MSGAYERVWEFVRRIPRGRVLTYGLVSHCLGGPLSAQGVGWALKALPEPGPGKKYSAVTVPWHRVINARGQTSTHKNPDIPPDLQRNLLEQEGVTFDGEGRVNLDQFLWVEGLNPDMTKSKSRGR